MNIGLFIYNDAEVLDFSGPFEVFSVAKRLGLSHWNVYLISESSQPIRARGGMNVTAHYSIDNVPKLDVLCVVGGEHTATMQNTSVLAWLARVNASTTITCSICTGVFILAAAGVLQRETVTTHWQDLDELKKQFPYLGVVSNKRWVEDGKYVTSGGISAGIDMSLFLVSKLTDMPYAKTVARQMEYEWCE